MASKYDSLIDEVAAPSSATPADQYGALIDEVTSAAPLHSSLFEAMDSNPQVEAEKRKLAKQLNTPAAILPADAKQRALFTEVNAEELQSKAPSTAKFLTNPDNAKITGLQGVKSLTNIEAAARSYKPDEITRFIRDYTATGKSAAEASQKLAEMKAKGINLSEYNDPYRRTTGEAITDLGKTITSGTDRMVASMVELSRPLNRLTQALGLAMGAASEVMAKGSGSVFFDAARAAKDNVEQTQQTLNETAKYWQDSKSTGMKRLNDKLAKAGALDSIGLLIKHPSLLADQLAQSIPYLAPGAAAARGGEAAVLVSNSLIEAADAANSAREQAKAFGATPEQQDKAATAAALVAAPLVFLGNKLLGTGKLEASFFTKGTTGHSLLQSAVREFVSGSIEEGANQLGANVGAATYDENQQLLEGVGKAALLGGFLESTHGVAMSATGRALQAYLDDAQAVGSAADNRMEQAAQAEAVQSAMASMSEAVATDTLRQNAPESFAEFVGTMVDDGAESDLKEVYVDGQTALQAMEPNYAELRQSAPELLATVEEAATNGTDAAISVPEYLTSIAGKPFEASILAALKADPTGVTYTEAQQFYQEQRKLFETDVAAVEVANEPVLSRTQYEATPVEGKTYDTYLKEHNNKREAYARDVEQVESSIMGQFQSAGRFTSSVNRTYTTPLVEFYKTQAKRLNMTPSELYAKYPFKVQSFLDFNPSTDLSQPNPATVEDLRPENIQGLLDKADWSILTPENPLGVATPERNPELRAQFEARLAEMGLQFMAVEGKYGNPENSYVVFGVTPEQALALGKEFNQESVLTRDGLIYQNGTRTPATGELTVFDTQPDDYYSKVTFPDGSVSVFSVGLDFDVSLQPGETYINPALVGEPGLQPLAGVPKVEGFYGPDPAIVSVAEAYAAARGIPFNRQAEYVEVNESLARRIAQAYDAMPHDPTNPEVKEAYQELIEQTKAQYDALVAAGYRFWFTDATSTEYVSTPWNAMRDIRANKSMGVFPTEQGFGTSGFDPAENPLLADTGLTWPSGSLTGEPKRVLANDLFRAVHDAFGHGLEGSGFRARGEENAWQAHIRLFTGKAKGAITTETRGQNSWLNYGPYGDTNRTAAVEDTVFADQKTGLMPAWTWQEGIAPDDTGREIPMGSMPGVFSQGENLREGQVSLVGVHYSKQQRNVLNGAYYGTGIKGAEGERLRDAKDARIRRRLYFYIDEGKGVFPEYGVGNFKHVVKLPNMYDASKNPLKLPTRDAYGQRDMNLFESAVLDAGFDGYYIREAFHRQGAAVMLGDASTSVEPMADVFAQSNSAPTFYSPLLRAVQDAKLDNVPATQWAAWLNSNAAKLGIKKDEIEWTGITDWLALQNGKVSKADVAAYLDSNGVQVEEVMRGARFTNEDELLLAELEGRDPVLDLPDESATQVLDTKYATYVVPGGENYKELLITLPEETNPRHVKLRDEIVRIQDVAMEQGRDLSPEEVLKLQELRAKLKTAGPSIRNEKYRSSHWDEPNILAHVRFDERTDTDGNKVLFINEVQSDWGQEGKKKGFSGKTEAKDAYDTYVKDLKERYISAIRAEFATEISNPDRLERQVANMTVNVSPSHMANYFDESQKLNRLARAMNSEQFGDRVPQAPFVTDTKAWVALAVKRMMRYAADNGFAKIAFINGQQAADLYDLSKQIDSVNIKPSSNGEWILSAYKDGDRVMQHFDVKSEQLPDYVGKDVADKLLAQEPNAFNQRELSGIDLKVGGEGMRAFYDQIVPQVVNDVLKKVGGGKVGVAEVSIGKGVIEGMPTIGNVYTEQKAITITPEMSAKIAQGQALFQTQPGGMRGSFNPGTLTMSLLNGSDLSTVIHESGHFYLEMLRTLANDQAATDELVADYMTTLGWFGLTKTEWESMTLDQQRPYHEQWAESFELWNLEGQAPTSELQPIFSRFRAWMLSVYKSVEEFLRRNPAAGKLNDEVRAVFSRLVASQDAILTTQAARGMQPLFDNAEQAGVSPAQFEDYTALGKRATDDAVASLQARSMRDMRWASNARSKALRELQKKAKAQRAAVREEVATEVMSEPVNQARTFLRTGKVTDPNTGELIEVVKGFKLDREMLDAMYPAGALDRPDLTAIRGMTSADGLAPDTVAGMFGFTSGDALVRSLISEEPFGDKIEGLTDQRMLEEYGDLVDEKSMERAADEEVHNEARARFVATGLKILSKTPISVTQINKAAKAAAETQIGNKKVRDLRPKQYLAAETKANRAALAAVAKDPIEASRQQRNALLNNRLAMAAQEAVAEVEKAIKYLGKFNNEGTRKNLDLEYLEQIDAMLEPFDLRKGLSLTTIDAQTSLAEWIQQQEDMGFEPTIDPEQIANLRGKSYKNLTMSELRALVDTVKQVEHMGRMKKKLLTAIDKAEFAERIAEAKASIALNANRSVPERGTPADTLGLFGQWFRQMMAAHRKFASYIRELDGGTWNGVMFDLMLRGATTAANTEAEMRAQASDRLGSLFSKLPTRFGGIMNMVARKKLIPGTTISLTDEQRVMVAMNWGNDGNRQRLLDGGITGRKALTPGEVRAILDTLTKEEWDFVQGIFDFIAEYKPQIEALERTLTGKTPEWVPAAPIETKFGIYPGGYFPAKYDTVLSTRSDALEAATDLRAAMRGAFGAAAARNGYTKARAQAVVGRPLLLNFNAISRHVNEVIHRLAWQPWLIDSNRVVKALDSDLRQTLGAEATKEMQDVLIDIARGDAPAATPVEVAINRVRAGTSIVGMGWKITTALLQPAGLTNSFARIGGRHMAKGLARYLANPIVADAWVNENSALMRNRGRTMNREMNEILNEVRTDKGTSALKGSYFYMIGKMQRMVDVPTYLGAYERALEELNFESAVDEADRNRITAKAHDIAGQTVKDVQGGGELMDLAKAQRGSPFSKLFTNFYSYMNTVYNMNVEAFRTTKFTSPTEVAIFTAEMLLINIVPVIMTVALKNLLKGDCAWDDVECVLAKYKSEQVSHFFGQVLLLREVGVAVDVATGGDAFGYSGPAGLRFFADLYKTGQQANQGDLDMPLIKSANNAAGALFHYPASSLNNVFETAVAVENGDVEGAAIIPSLIAGPPR